MTSKKSFWDNLKGNNKRRGFVWIISILTHLVLWPGFLLIYFSRIHQNRSLGIYNTSEEYKRALAQAAADALGFQNTERTVIAILLLAVLVGLQGFFWLHDKRKLDFYKSVPVKEKDRFFTIYVNSILIYLLPYLGSIVLSLLIAALQGGISGVVLGKCAMSALMNFVWYLLNLHLVILVVALTGNKLVACFGIFILNMLNKICEIIFTSMKRDCFKNHNQFFEEKSFHVYGYNDFFSFSTNWKQETKLSGIVTEMLPVAAQWILLAAILLILAYLCYRKRPAERVGKAVVFVPVWNLFKIVLSVLGALGAAFTVYEASYENVMLAVLAMLAAALLISVVMDVVYDLDIRSFLKHPLSTGAALAISLAIFCIYQFDLFGYDTYIPENDKIASAAVFMGNYSQDFWEYTDDKTGRKSMTIAEYLDENMFLQDTEAVRELAQKSIELRKELDAYEPEEKIMGRRLRYVSVLFRLTSGRNVARSYIIDLQDAETAKLADRIIGTKEYREGWYELAKHEDYMKDPELRLYYSNGSMQQELSPSFAGTIREAWLKDMEQYDYTFAMEHDMCGKLSFVFSTYIAVHDLPVYENFENTITLLKELDAYYPLQPPVSSIDSISVTNFNYIRIVEATEYDPETLLAWGSAGYAQGVDRFVTVTYEEPQQIEEILQGLYPDDLSQEWKRTETYDDNLAFADINYTITIAFKPNTEYPYKQMFSTYSFKNGCVPDFVAQDTTFKE